MKNKIIKFNLIVFSLLLLIPFFKESDSFLIAQDLRIDSCYYTSQNSRRRVDCAIFRDSIRLPTRRTSISSMTLILRTSININNLRFRIPGNRDYSNFQLIERGNYLYGNRVTLLLRNLSRTNNLIEFNYYTSKRVVRNFRININWGN